MVELRAIRGGKPKAMAQARVLECPCGSRSLIEVRIGVVVDKHNKVVHRGTLARKCAHCGRMIE